MHMKYRSSVLGLGAALRPAGSVNREVLANTRGTHATALLDQDTRLRELIHPDDGAVVSLEQAYEAFYLMRGWSRDIIIRNAVEGAHAALLCPVMGGTAWRLVPVFSISQQRVRSTGTKSVSTIVVVTPEGEAALSGGTLLVLDRAAFKPSIVGHPLALVTLQSGVLASPTRGSDGPTTA